MLIILFIINLVFSCFNENRLTAKSGGLLSNDLKNAEVGTVYHEIYTKKKPNFMHVLSEGLEHTVKTPKMAYMFTYGSIIAQQQFRCKVRLLF